MERYFYLDTSPVYTNKYVIRINTDKMPFPKGTSGSYNVLVDFGCKHTYNRCNDERQNHCDRSCQR